MIVKKWAVLEKTAVKGQYDNIVEPGMITTTPIIGPTIKGALRSLSYPHILFANINHDLLILIMICELLHLLNM